MQTRYQDDPEAPEVAGLVVAGAVEELGGGVLQREAGRLQGGASGRAQAREAEVHELQGRVLPFVREQHVLSGAKIRS